MKKKKKKKLLISYVWIKDFEKKKFVKRLFLQITLILKSIPLRIVSEDGGIINITITESEVNG